MPAYKPVHRIFFALRPNNTTAGALVETIARLQAGGVIRTRPLAQSRLHMTLHFLGDFEEFPADLIADVLRDVDRFRYAPFCFALDRMISFRGRNPPYVLLAGHESTGTLCGFWRTLGQILGLPPEQLKNSQFKPHVTLAYGDQALAGSIAIEPIEWLVEEFVLIESLVGKSTHNQLGAWPLRG